MKKKILVFLFTLVLALSVTACAKKYQVSFVTNMEGLTLETIKVAEGTEIDTTSKDYVLSADGYSFKGWYLDSSFRQFARTVTVESDLTFYAKWAKIYKVSFVSNGGTSVSDAYIEEGSSIQDVASPTREGYVFSGWYTDEALEHKYDSSSPVSSNLTLYASWLEGLTVRFNTVGGSEIADVAIYSGSLLKLPQAPIKTGYEFKGWYKNAALTEEFNASLPVTENLSLYAKWEAYKYQIEFNANGSTGTMNVLNLTYDQESTLPKSTLTKTGYSFEGWALSQTGEVVYKDGQKVKNLTDENDDVITLYAIFSANEYTITFHSNFGEDQTSTQEMVYDQVGHLTKNAFEYTGHTFSGWATTSDGVVEYADEAEVSNLIASKNGNIHLYAKYDVIVYSVKFEKNLDAEVIGTMSDQAIEAIQTTELKVNAYTSTGYSFKGWSLSATGEVKYADAEEVSGAQIGTLQENGVLILYAVWEETTYNVTLKANYGVQDDKHLSGNYFDGITLPKNDYTRTGYSFGGWSLSQNGEKAYNDEAELHILENVTLYAVWTPNTYTVKFVAAGASGTMDDQTMTYDQKAQLSKYAFTKAGYAFIGWALSQDGDVVYNDEDEVKNLATSGDFTLYAVYEANSYRIVFNANGTAGSMASQSYKYDEVKALSANTFSYQYKKFAGWALSATGEVVYADKQEVSNLTTSGDVELYAVWEDNYYEISYNANSGTGSMAIDKFDLASEKSLISHSTMSKAGYHFMSWNTKADGTGDQYSENAQVDHLTDTPKEVVTLYAQWEANTYTVKYNANDGEGTLESSTHVYDQDKALSKNTFTRTGYTFTGWALSSTGEKVYDDEEVVKNLAQSGEVTLYAVWTAHTYTVRFYKNNEQATGEMADQSFTYDELKALTKNAFVLANMKFAGWAKSSTQALSFTDQEVVSNLTATNEEVIALYAVWADNYYTVRYNPNTGVGSVTSYAIDLASEGLTISQELFTKAGYTFVSWNTKADGTGTSYTKGQVLDEHLATNGETVTLYAIWTANTNTAYTVEHYQENANNSEYTLDSTENKEGTTDELTAATPNSYTGFTAQPFSQVTINGNGETVVKIYYKRNVHTLSWTTDGYPLTGTYTSGQVKYGASIVAPETPTKTGYTFK